MRALIQVRWRPGWGAAQPSSTASKLRLIATVKRSDRTVRARRDGTPELVERNDSAQCRLDPVECRIVGTVGHRENAASIGFEQNFRRYFKAAESRLAMMIRALGSLSCQANALHQDSLC